MFLNIILLIVGFIILIKGADIFVDGAASIAGNFKVSKMLIGLTIVAFGTSAPEFAVSVKSLLSGNGDMILGNVIGSNILNIVLILGVSSMFHSLTVKNNTVKKELPITILITTLFSVLIFDNIFDKKFTNELTRSDGIVLLLFFMVFIYYLIRMARNKIDEDQEEVYMPIIKAIAFTIVGIISIIFGSNMVVDNASRIAINLGISEKMVALTIIALGTSLPELVTSIVAARKNQLDMAIGNVIGSNIFNILFVLGIAATISPIPFAVENIIDICVLLFFSILIFIFCITRKRINRIEGAIMVALYVLFMVYVCLRETGIFPVL